MRRSVFGSNQTATTKPTRHSTAWTTKIARHPTESTNGAPITTPITGEPAVTKLQ